MCGIAGQFKFKSVADPLLVARMTGVLAHRGPDGEGFFHDGPIALGMRRLRIIDLETGNQPIHNADKSVWVVFNGEIYNYRSIRARLEQRGYKFYTQSDTEVIVHCYEAYGEDFVSYLEGMFAIALWDDRRKQLVLARDRVGEKPLYYYSDTAQLLFASELKSILECTAVPRTINPAALHYYFSYGRVPSPHCIIANVQKLAPATMAIIRDGTLRLKKYWTLSFKEKFTASFVEIKNQLCVQFENSVAHAMVADVPLGAFLSGGVDSSAVVAMMAKHSTKPVQTFSVGFNEEDFSELRYARIVAQQFGTDHHEYIVDPNVMDVLPKLIWHLDEPFADFSIIPTFYVAQAARRHITVALTGDGADELFAGYEWFKAIKLGGMYRKLPEFVRDVAYYVTRLLPDVSEREHMIRYVHKLRRFAETQRRGVADPLSILLSMTSGFTEDVLRAAVYSPGFLRAISGVDSRALRNAEVDRYDGDDPLEAILYSQFSSLLPDTFFTKVDRASMAASLETRAPFVDHHLVEFAAKIPFRYKLHGLTTKYILKEAMRGILPPAIILRHKKGFSLPLARWLRNGALYDDVRATLSDPSFRNLEFFNDVYVSELIQQHHENVADNTNKIWPLYMFALWHREFIHE